MLGASAVGAPTEVTAAEGSAAPSVGLMKKLTTSSLAAALN